MIILIVLLFECVFEDTSVTFILSCMEKQTYYNLCLGFKWFFFVSYEASIKRFKSYESCAHFAYLVSQLFHFLSHHKQLR